MKKKIFIIMIPVITFIFAYFVYSFVNNSNQNWNGYKSITYTIDNKKYRLLVADTEQKREKGLMNVTKLDGYDGMIFLFQTTEYVTFWNKNTITDLDLYWISGDKVIGKDELPSINKSKNEVIIQSPGPANKVIELIK